GLNMTPNDSTKDQHDDEGAYHHLHQREGGGPPFRLTGCRQSHYTHNGFQIRRGSFIGLLISFAVKLLFLSKSAAKGLAGQWGGRIACPTTQPARFIGASRVNASGDSLPCQTRRGGTTAPDQDTRVCLK